MIKRWIIKIIRQTLQELDSIDQERAEFALSALKKKEKKKYLLDNAHRKHHTQSSVLCWKMKQIREQMSKSDKKGLTQYER